MFLFLLSLAAEIYSDKIKTNETMDVTNLPFNRMIGLKYADKPDYLLMLDDNIDYHNHLETVHASAQFALAEATSGYFLQDEFTGVERIIPVVRTSTIKFRKPGNGKIFSRAQFGNVEKEQVMQSLADRKKIGLTVDVTLFDELGTMIMQASFDWVILPDNSKE